MSSRGFFARMLGNKTSDNGSATSARDRLSILVRSDGNSEMTRELEERIRQTIHNYFEELQLLDKVSIEDVCHNLSDEGVMEVQIPLPEDKV